MTNLSWQCKRVVRYYNQRGTAEQWIREGKNAVKWTKLSCHDFVDNHARLQLFALASNLGNFIRRLVLPRPMKTWTMTTLPEKLITIGAKGGAVCQGRNLPDGGGGHTASVVESDSGTNYDGSPRRRSD